MNENRNLKVQCNKYHEKYHSLRETYVKNQMRIQELEDARDQLFESSQRQKVNINKYLATIRQQADKIKQMQNTIQSQNIRNSTGGGLLSVLSCLFETL